MDALLVWLEGSPLGELMRSSGVWTYGVLNLVHILSVATLFGSVLVLDLRLLGAWRQVPLAATFIFNLALLFAKLRRSLRGLARGVGPVSRNFRMNLLIAFLLVSSFPANLTGQTEKKQD